MKDPVKHEKLHFIWQGSEYSTNLADNYLFRVNNRNT